jgi:hypothetical protein
LHAVEGALEALDQLFGVGQLGVAREEAQAVAHDAQLEPEGHHGEAGPPAARGGA